MSDQEWQPPTATLPEPQPERRPSALRTAAVVGGIVVLLGAVGFAAYTLLGSDTGSPEEAAQELFDAVANEDVIGMLEALPPSEREVFQDPLTDMTEELKRLDVLAGDFELRGIDGIDLAFEDLEFRTEDLADDITAVTVEDGTARYRLEPDEFPFGDFLEDVLGEDLPTEPQEDSTDIGDEAEESGEPLRLVALREDDSWYISLGYTIAEAARRSSDQPAPDFGEGVQPEGADSPEGALEAMIEAGLALDLERMIALLPPGEARALHDYAPLFLDDAEEAVAEADFSAELRSIEFDTEEDGSRARVSIREFEVDFEADGESGTVAYDGECFSFDSDSESEEVCPEDAGVVPPEFEELSGQFQDQGFTVVEEDGDWYVSPTGTVLDTFVEFLAALDEDSLDDLREFFETMTGAGFEEEFQIEGDLELDEGFSFEDEPGEAGPAPEQAFDVDGDGLIGSYTPEEFAKLPPSEQQAAIQEEFELAN